MPRYFEVIGDTAKLAREKIKREFANLSIIKEEKVVKLDWRWCGLRRKSFYRIVVSEYRTSTRYLGMELSKDALLHEDAEALLEKRSTATGCRGASKLLGQQDNSQRNAAKAIQKLARDHGSSNVSSGRNTRVHGAHSVTQTRTSGSSSFAKADLTPRSMQESLKKFVRSVETIEHKKKVSLEAKNKNYTLFDYPIPEAAPVAKAFDGLKTTETLASPLAHSLESPLVNSSEKSLVNSLSSPLVNSDTELAQRPMVSATSSDKASESVSVPSVAAKLRTAPNGVELEAVNPVAARALSASSETQTTVLTSQMVADSQTSEATRFLSEPLENTKILEQALLLVEVKADTLNSTLRAKAQKPSVRHRKQHKQGLAGRVRKASERNVKEHSKHKQGFTRSSDNTSSSTLDLHKKTSNSIKDIVTSTTQSTQKVKGVSVATFLQERDFSPEIIAETIEFSFLKTIRHAEDKQILAEALAAFITYAGELTVVSRSEETAKREPKLVFMAGSTGVGKTTTLSKLAFRYGHARKAKIAIASYDLRRMAAFEQLKSFADIIKVPLKKLEEKSSILELYHENQNADLIFVDTPGCSVQELALIAEIADLMHYLNAPKEIYGCIPTASRTRDLLATHRSFGAMKCSGLIFTKVDESTSLGSVLSLAYQSKLPVSYLCTGQDILKDFEVASLENMQKLLLNEWTHP